MNHFKLAPASSNSDIRDTTGTLGDDLAQSQLLWVLVLVASCWGCSSDTKKQTADGGDGGTGPGATGTGGGSNSSTAASMASSAGGSGGSGTTTATDVGGSAGSGGAGASGGSTGVGGDPGAGGFLADGDPCDWAITCAGAAGEGGEGGAEEPGGLPPDFGACEDGMNSTCTDQDGLCAVHYLTGSISTSSGTSGGTNMTAWNSFCTRACNADSDCTVELDGATAEPRCITHWTEATGYEDMCVLDCSSERTCPAPLVCYADLCVHEHCSCFGPECDTYCPQ